MATATPPKPKPPARDAVREVFETVVFVVVLVLMLKLFVVEAFVIPTGSMAETLLGYNKLVTCRECGFEYPVNASNEVDPSDGPKRPILGACCPNCRHLWVWADKQGRPTADAPSNRSGDRVLVHKALYEFGGGPTRGDVVVFKYPVDPQIGHTAQNYIKRLWGLGGETLAIHNGDIYLTRALTYPPADLGPDGQPLYPRPDDPLRSWEGPDVSSLTKTGYPAGGQDYTYHNRDAALDLFEKSRHAGFAGPDDKGFVLHRKPDPMVLSMRRIVYDNDHQSAKLVAIGVPPRWSAEGGWTPDDPRAPKVFTRSGDGTAWLRYQHRVPADEHGAWMRDGGPLSPDRFRPSPITNFLGYNSGIEDRTRQSALYWVGDLILECRAKVSGPGDEVVLELSEGVDRFRARFKDGKVTVGRPGGDLATKDTPITSAGEYDLRFANVDCRLRVWVDGTAIDLGVAADYPPTANGHGLGALTAAAAVTGAALAAPGPNGMTEANDVLAPAGVGASGGVVVSKLVLWKDTFFTPYADGAPAEKVDTFYVQPGHYLCLGDNSGQSSDSRRWGLVPERLMLGKAAFVFWPLPRIGFIR